MQWQVESGFYNNSNLFLGQGRSFQIGNKIYSDQGRAEKFRAPPQPSGFTDRGPKVGG